MFKKMPNVSNLLYTMLVAVFFVGCNEYPRHTVCEGITTMVVYKSEKYDKIEYGKYKYAITDASGGGWTFVSNQKYNVGDTIRISK